MWVLIRGNMGTIWAHATEGCFVVAEWLSDKLKLVSAAAALPFTLLR